MVLPEAVAYRVLDEHDLVAVAQRAHSDLRETHGRHDPADNQPLSAGRLHRLHERDRLPRVLCVPVDRRDVGELGRERRNRGLSDAHLDADRAEDDRDLETHGQLRELAGVELDEPSVLLEHLRQYAVLVIDQQQRAVRRIPHGPPLLTHVQPPDDRGAPPGGAPSREHRPPMATFASASAQLAWPAASSRAPPRPPPPPPPPPRAHLALPPPP